MTSGADHRFLWSVPQGLRPAKGSRKRSGAPRGQPAGGRFFDPAGCFFDPALLPAYQSTLAPSCTMRPSRSVDTGAKVGFVTMAPVAAVTAAVVFMVVIFGWLKTLFASMKNFGWKRSHSLKKVRV